MKIHSLHRAGMRPGNFPLAKMGIFCLIFVLLPAAVWARMFIDINAPSSRKFNIAIPDFNQVGSDKNRPDLSTELPGIVSSDLDFSGFFTPMDKGAFLEDKGSGSGPGAIQFKNWSVIGAELLLKGEYSCVGNQLEVEIRLYDVFMGRQILGKRALGDVDRRRALMHRLSYEIIQQLTGYPGIFLTKIAFVDNSTGNREIYISDYDGYGAKQATHDKSIALLPRWSPDGKYLAYNSYKMESRFLKKDMGKQAGPLLYLKDMGSGRITLLSGQPGLNTGAAWAPNSQEIALTMSHMGNPDIFTIDLQGKILRQVVQGYGIDVSPAFSPDGSKIAFVSNRSGSPQVYVMDLASKREERLTYEGGYNTSPAWSSRNRIAFVSMTGGRFVISSIDPDGKGLKKLTENSSNSEEPCWSPDGRYIMFTSDRGGGGYHLHLMNANGQNQKRILTSTRGQQTAPCWGPLE